MHGEPDRRLLPMRARDAVARVRRDVQVIAGRELARCRFALELELGFAGDEEHPFGPILVVPEAGWAAWPSETMRSIRTLGADGSSVNSSSARAAGRSAKRFPVVVTSGSLQWRAGLLLTLPSDGGCCELESLGHQLVRALACAVIVDERRDHDLVGLCRLDQRHQLGLHGRRTAHEQARAVRPYSCTVGVR